MAYNVGDVITAPGGPPKMQVHIRTVAGSANFVKPTSPAADYHLVRLWHAGAAGGGTTGAGSGLSEGAGGGEGGYTEKWYLDSELAASEPYTVGAGGVGVSGGVGGSGGLSSFKGLSGSAATGGSAMTSGTGSQGSTPGRGGTGTGGNLNLTGADGGFGRSISGNPCFNNFGGGGSQQTDLVAGNGSNGASPGGGGSGSFSSSASFAGGNGADGKIEIVSFFA